MKKIILLTLILTTPAWAFTLNNSGGAKFGSNEVTLNVEGSEECANIGLSNQELLDAAFEAMDEFWNRAPTSNLKIIKGEVVQITADFHNLSMCTNTTGSCIARTSLKVPSGIMLSCNDNATDFSSTRILGLTYPNNTSGRTIVGSLVMINDKAGTQFASKTYHEKKTIIAHEVGHALGLGHSPVEDSLMFYLHNPNRQYLGQDDIDGISFLYPAEQPKISSCGTISTDQNKNAPQRGALLTMLGMFLGMLIARVLFFKRSSSL